MLASSLTLPPWVESGLRPAKRGSKVNRIIYGGDTETCRGLPMTLQFYSEDIACSEIFFVNESDAMERFLKWCGSLKTDTQHVIYIHNLEFDIVELFWSKKIKLIGEGGSGDFEFRHGKWNISGVFGGPYFAKITDGHHRMIYLIDTFSWFRGSLANAAGIFCPNLPKLKRVEGIGEKLFKKSDANFVDYAMRDAVIAYHIGKAIDAFHARYDIGQSVSVADMASRIFRRKFLTYEIPLPSREIVDAAFAAYHGGKNNITAAPGWYEDVNALDISSAYPWVMREQPAYSNVKLYRAFRAKAGTKVFPEHGVYCVNGTAKKTPYPVIFSHAFKPLTDCDVSDVWVQGYELNEAIASGDFKCGKVRGYFYDAEKDHQAPALRGYVDDFYSRKETERDKVLRYQFKLMLNSISGKFVQTRKRGAAEFTDVDSGETVTASDLIAGGLFHPWIAAEITAKTRARIRRMEGEHKALHTATDGILTRSPVRRVREQWHDTRPANKKSREIGRVTVEAEDATLLLVRCKLYILYGDESESTTPSKVFKGKHIIKTAFHGFQGNATALEKLVASNRRKYEVNRPNKLKSTLAYNVRAKAKGLPLRVPNNFEKHEMTLKVGPLKVQK